MTRTNLFHTLFLVASLSVIATPVFSQTDTTVYAVVDYMKVQPGKEQAYVDLEQKTWQAIHQERLKARMIVGWYLYSVRFPAGSNYEYNYTTVNVVNKFADLDFPFSEELVLKAHPKAKLPELINNTLAARDRVWQKVWVLLDQVRPETPQPTPSRHVTIDYMKVKPGGEQAYLDLEQKLWKPVHQLRVKSGLGGSWQLYALLYPGGSGTEYNYGTANFFKNFTDLENPYPGDLFARALPNMALSELEAKTMSARDLVRSEVWELIDYVQ